MAEHHQNGLYLANMGSIYDNAQSTTIGSSFEKTERAIKKQPFDTFYTVNLTNEKPQPVQFVKQNRFEGRSNYFNYYPTDTYVEQRLETVWFEH